MSIRSLAAALALLLLAGCASIGPSTVQRDRVGYVAAISDSWKQQMLLNLLKVRYGDAPVFLDVTSIINAYSLDGELQAGGQHAPPGRGDTFAGIGALARYSDRPTISYVPLTGDKFARSIMSPIPVSAILLLVQSGYSAEIVLRLCASSINDLANPAGSRSGRAGDPRFTELLGLLRAEQLTGGLGFEARPDGPRTRTVMLLRSPVDAAMGTRHARIRELLALRPGQREYDVAYGSFAKSDAEVAMLSRSMLQVMIDVASTVETPPDDVAQGRVAESIGVAADRSLTGPVRVHASPERSSESFVAVYYRERWYWIDDRDYASKTAFSFLMLLFSLTETSSSQAAPVVTVPAR